jgi:hypothetical protein
MRVYCEKCKAWFGAEDRKTEDKADNEDKPQLSQGGQYRVRSG